MHTQTWICILPDTVCVHKKASHKTYRWGYLIKVCVVKYCVYKLISSWLYTGVPHCAILQPQVMFLLCHIIFNLFGCLMKPLSPFQSVLVLQSTVVKQTVFEVLRCDSPFPFLQLAFEMFPPHSWWLLTLFKCPDGIQKGSQSQGMLMACPSQCSWCWMIGPSSDCVSTTSD